LVFPKLRCVVFVHGCFWHQHRCADGHVPKSRKAYWLPKLDRNRKRDRLVRSALRKLGWRTLVIWECETRDAVGLAKRLKTFLGENVRTGTCAHDARAAMIRSKSKSNTATTLGR
jgi:DNA mismatch endonuclease (patch repair protein)